MKYKSWSAGPLPAPDSTYDRLIPRRTTPQQQLALIPNTFYRRMRGG